MYKLIPNSGTIEDTFKTFLKDKNNKPLNVTQREIDAGLAIREFTKKNKRTGKSETTAVQYPLMEGNIVKDKKIIACTGWRKEE